MRRVPIDKSDVLCRSVYLMLRHVTARPREARLSPREKLTSTAAPPRFEAKTEEIERCMTVLGLAI